MPLRRLMLLLPVLAGPAVAQEVAPCQGRADARNVVEPWEGHARSFAGGAVRVALVDLGEPAAGALYLLVLTPPYTAGRGERHCHLVGHARGAGFAAVAFADLVPAADPATGLTLAVPARVLDPDGAVKAGLLTLVIDKARGTVAARFSLTGGN